MAVALACGNTSQHGRCVREHTERAAQQNNSKEGEPTEGTPPLDKLAKGAAHQFILRRGEEKTDSPVSPGV